MGSETSREGFTTPEPIYAKPDLADELSHLEQTVLHMRYGDDNNPPMSLGQVAKAMGMTRKDVRWTEQTARRKQGYDKE